MPETRYLAIADALADELTDAPSGSRVPSETAVADRFDVGRSAARAAIVELERRGLVRRAQGAGTFVTRPLMLNVAAGERSAWEQLVRTGMGRTSVPMIRAGTLPQSASAAMGLPPGQPGLRLSMQMSALDQIVGRSTIWTAGTERDILSDALKEHEELLRAIDAAQVNLTYVSATVTLDHAGAELVAELGFSVDRRYWKVDAVLGDASKGVYVWARTEFRADRITLVLNVGSSHR